MSPGIWVLQNAPRLTYFVVGVVFVFVVISLVRRITEGRAYSVSWSGTWGETPLFLIWTLGSIVVENAPVPAVVLNPWVNLAIAVFFIIVGLYQWSRPDGHPTFVDGFHNAVVVPVFGYFTAICMILFLLTMYFLFLAVGFACLVIWGFFVRKDFRERRMQQAVHVEETGTTSIFGTKLIVDTINAVRIIVLILIIDQVLGMLAPRLAFAF